MTKSRKLFVAAALLAGGYGVAYFLGGAPSDVGRNSGTLSANVNDGRVFSAIYDFAHGVQASSPTGQLVPDHGPVAKVPTSPLALVPQQMPQQPTWLVATTPARETLPPIEPPKFADPPALAESDPIASTNTAPAEPHAPPVAPKARITNVVSTATGTNEKAASPWDRWPWWDASAPTGSMASPIGIHASTGPAPQPIRSAAMPVSFNDCEPARTIPEQCNGDSPIAHPGGRAHVVVDGDSLAKLADRYLDDAALGDEIYRLNQDILGDPQLLPIGVELRIPENRVGNSTDRFAGAMGLQAAHSGPPAGMVPVEWQPRPFDSEPRAQLLRPIPAGRSD